MREYSALFAATMLALASAIGLPQESIRVDVNLVTVSFSVRDADGALVDNLTRDDFDLAEDAVPQKIAHFARSVDVPLTLGLIVDASGSQEHFAKKHQHDLEVFLKDVLGPRDRVFLVGFGNHIRLVSDYSQSSAGMIEAWKQYEKETKRFPELGPREDRDLGTAFYDSIFYSVTEKLAKEDGRRALLMFSDGEDNSSLHDMMTAIEASQFANGIRVMDRIAKETGGAHIDAETTDPHTYR